MSPTALGSDLSGVTSEAHPHSPLLHARLGWLFGSRLSFQGKHVTLGHWNDSGRAGTHPGGQTRDADAGERGRRPVAPPPPGPRGRGRRRAGRTRVEKRLPAAPLCGPLSTPRSPALAARYGGGQLYGTE